MTACSTRENYELWIALRSRNSTKVRNIILNGNLDFNDPLVMYAAMGNDTFAVKSFCQHTTNIAHLQNAHSFLLKYKNNDARKVVINRYHALLKEQRDKRPKQKPTEKWTPPERPLVVNRSRNNINNKKFMEYATIII